MYVHHTHDWYPEWSEEATGSAGTRTTDVREPYVGAILTLGPL